MAGDDADEDAASTLNAFPCCGSFDAWVERSTDCMILHVFKWVFSGVSKMIGLQFAESPMHFHHVCWIVWDPSNLVPSECSP